MQTKAEAAEDLAGARRPPKKIGRFASTCRKKKDLDEKRLTSPTNKQDRKRETKERRKLSFSHEKVSLALDSFLNSVANSLISVNVI